MMFKKQPKETILYTDTNIPAKLFFDILDTQDFSKLGTAPLNKLEQVFDSIYDQYVDLQEDDMVKTWYNNINKIQYTKLKLAILENLLYIVNYVKMTNEEREFFIHQINSIEDRPATENFPARYLVKFEPKSLSKQDIKDEVQRVQNTAVAFLKNEIFLLETNKKEDRKEIKYQYLDDLASMVPVMGYIKPNISLEEFVALKKAYKKIVEQKTKNNGSR